MGMSLPSGEWRDDKTDMSLPSGRSRDDKNGHVPLEPWVEGQKILPCPSRPFCKPVKLVSVGLTYVPGDIQNFSGDIS